MLDAALSQPFHIGIDGAIPPKLRDVVRLLLKKMTLREFLDRVSWHFRSVVSLCVRAHSMATSLRTRR